ncbi:MAG TPA: cobalt ECF transporter T component CbiQ [Gemmatimonadales bacterium]|nr:cobalt ECF transporter T component CbiQ [Gemmatimonadales bacterium]
MSFHHLDRFASVRSPVTRLHAVSRLAGTVILALGAATLPQGAWVQLAALGAVVLGIAVVARIPPAVMARRTLWPLAFVVAGSFLLPLVVPGRPIAHAGPLTVSDAGILRFATVVGRAAVALGAAVLLVSTTAFPELLQALRRLRLPPVVTASLGLGYRLLYILMEEIERLGRAARSRNAGAGAAHRRRLLVGIAAAVLGRALARGERTHRAMLARGYDGDLPGLHDRAPAAADAAALTGLAAAVAAIALWART